MSVRDVLREFPVTRSIFDAHGLLGCGGPGGPDEPVAFFARLHEVDPDQLLDELNSRVRQTPHPAPATIMFPGAPMAQSSSTAAAPASPPPGPRLYRRFITAALVITLTLGATWGVINLAWIMYALGPVPASHVQAHGHAQVFGFLYLFIMGVAYQVIPRFRGRPLKFPELAAASFVFLLGGVLARTVGQTFGYDAFGHFLLAASAALYLLGVGSFAVVVVATARPERSRVSVPPGAATRRAPTNSRMEPYILAGIFWMVVSTAYAAFQAFVLANNNLVSLSNYWQRPLWFISLFGAALSWVFGIGTRVLPGFLATRPARQNLVRAGFFLLQGGVALLAISSLVHAGGGAPVARHLRLAATTAVGLAILVTFAALHGLRSVPDRRAAGSSPEVFRWFLRAGFHWAAVAGALLIVQSLLEWKVGREPHSLLQDAVRHIFTVGALVMIVLGMASRILPVFEGVAIQGERLMRVSFVLLNLGVVLRLAQVGAAYVWPDLMAVAGASGFLALAGISGMSIVLFRTMARGRRVNAGI